VTEDSTRSQVPQQQQRVEEQGVEEQEVEKQGVGEQEVEEQGAQQTFVVASTVPPDFVTLPKPQSVGPTVPTSD
jgi:hypothetical protein